MKYKTEWRSVLLVFGIPAVLGTLVPLMEPRSEYWLEAILLFDGWIILVVIAITIGSYVTIAESQLKSVFFFVYRPYTKVEDIQQIFYLPTWKFQELARSLYVTSYSRGQRKTIELKNSMFTELTLGKIAYDLKKINPRIELDVYTEKLMKAYMEDMHVIE